MGSKEAGINGKNPITPKKSLRQKILFALRIIVSLSLLTYLVLVVVPENKRLQILSLYLGVDLFYLFSAILLVFMDRVFSSWKWLLLMRVREPEVKALPVLQVFFVSTFLGYLLPSSIGGDALRIYSMGRVKGDLAGSASSVILDRAYGTLGMLMLAAFALFFASGETISSMDALLVWLFTTGIFVVVIVLSSSKCHQILERIANLKNGGKIRQKLSKLMAAFTSFVGKKWVLVKVFLFSFAVQVLRVLIVMFLGMSLGLRLDPLIFFIYVPIITAITFLPISLGGVGVRELLFVFFFSRPEIGVPKEVCISLSLLYFSMGIVATLPGAVIYMFTGMGKREEPVQMNAG